MTGAEGPLRVLHCAAGNLYGGVETLLKTLAGAGPSAFGLRHEFALCFEGRLAAEVRASGAAVHPLGAVRFSRPWTVLAARRRLGRLYGAGEGFDAVVTHGSWAHLLAAPARPLGPGRRPAVVFWMHDRVEAGRPHWVDRRAARLAPDGVVVNSRGTAETLPSLFPDAPAEVIRYPVPPPEPFDRDAARAALRAELDTPAGDVVIVSAARLERWKGQTLLLDALSRLRDRPGWTAWVAGGPQRPHEAAYLQELRDRAGRDGLAGRVRFAGQRADVPRLLAAADLHCQPNTGPEPFGIAFVEALHAGLPVVTTRLGGAVEIVDESCGRLVPPGDPDALAGALAALIDDPDARRRLGRAGPARASALCAFEATLPALERFLRDARPRPA